MSIDKQVCADLVAQILPGAEVTSVARLTGGVSADVYRLDVCTPGGGDASLVLRVQGATHSGHAAGLEYRLLQALYLGGALVPEPLMVDDSGQLLADPFLVMRYVEGDTQIPVVEQSRRVNLMATALHDIHQFDVSALPQLPLRLDPLPEVFDYLPQGSQWQELRDCLHLMQNTVYTDKPKLLHGDFWPENLMWQQGEIAAVLDWEDAAIGDPLSDVACCCVELRYKFGKPAMQQFAQAYAKQQPLDPSRLALWQVYVAAAAQCYMGGWGLPAAQEAHMRAEALASIREAGAILLSLH